MYVGRISLASEVRTKLGNWKNTHLRNILQTDSVSLSMVIVFRNYVLIIQNYVAFAFITGKSFKYDLFPH